MRLRKTYKPGWDEIEASYLLALEAMSRVPGVEPQHICEVTAHQPEGGIAERIFCHRDDSSRLADALWRRFWREGYLIRIVLDCRPMEAKDHPSFEAWRLDRYLRIEQSAFSSRTNNAETLQRAHQIISEASA